MLKNFSSAIVAGVESSNYLKLLKFKARNIFQPYDVVDNDYFFEYNSKEKFFHSNYFLCIARFVKKKNHTKLLDGFEIYKQRGGNLNLLIIGAGPEEKIIKEIKNRSKYSNSIFIKSWQNIDRLANYYKGALSTVLASTNDQWGLVVNESMASGTPAIVSKNCGCYSDLIDEGITGWGFDPNNPEELANILLRVEKIEKNELKTIKKNIKLKMNKYNLENFSEAIKDSISNSLVNRRFSLFSAILSIILFLLKNE
nr:glycosyltransferase [Prochlorococcus marinus]